VGNLGNQKMMPTRWINEDLVDIPIFICPNCNTEMVIKDNEYPDMPYDMPDVVECPSCGFMDDIQW
jgi:predicted RNA-binding Zn-ribbon protein involved in translation (DUF1610 family)